MEADRVLIQRSHFFKPPHESMFFPFLPVRDSLRGPLSAQHQVFRAFGSLIRSSQNGAESGRRM